MAWSPPACITTASSWSQHHCITTAVSSSLLQCVSSASYLSPLLCITTALSSWMHLRITAASSTALLLCFTTAPTSSMRHCISSASASSLYHCFSEALSLALHPDMTASLLLLGLGLISSSHLPASMLQSRGWGLLLLVPARKVLPRASGLFSRFIESWGLTPLLLVLTRMIQSGVSVSHLSLDDPVRGAAAGAACSARMIQSGALVFH